MQLLRDGAVRRAFGDHMDDREFGMGEAFPAGSCPGVYVRDVVEAATVDGLDGQHVSVPRVMGHHRSVDSYNAHDSSFSVRFQAATP